MADADICLLFGAHRDRRAEFKHDGVRHFVVTAFVDGKKFFEKRQAFLDALADDFNTPQAFAVLFEIVAEGNKRELAGARGALEELLPLLGLESLLAESDEVDPEAERLLSERERARAEKNFERADALRGRLGEMGWEVRDEAGGARLVRRR